jgi:hypothetical protein
MTNMKLPIQQPKECRHYDGMLDRCKERNIMCPQPICHKCKQYESVNAGLGDAMEKLIDFATLGQGKKIASKMSSTAGGCGCNKRRAALNRIGDTVTQVFKGDTDGN